MHIKKGDVVKAVDLYDRQWKEAKVLEVKEGSGASKGISTAFLEFMDGKLEIYTIDAEHIRLIGE